MMSVNVTLYIQDMEKQRFTAASARIRGWFGNRILVMKGVNQDTPRGGTRTIVVALGANDSAIISKAE